MKYNNMKIFLSCNGIFLRFPYFHSAEHHLGTNDSGSFTKQITNNLFGVLRVSVSRFK